MEGWAWEIEPKTRGRGHEDEQRVCGKTQKALPWLFHYWTGEGLVFSAPWHLHQLF